MLGISRQVAGTPRRMRQLHGTTDRMRQMTGACVILPETGHRTRQLSVPVVVEQQMLADLRFVQVRWDFPARLVPQ
jgi:hypothetical protein